MEKLVTERLVVRKIIESDIAALHKLHSIPEVDRYNTMGIPSSFSETEAQMMPLISANQLRRTRQYTFAIERLNDNAFIGSAALWLGKEKYRCGEIWYKFAPEYWKNGYATETVKALLKFGFDELNLHRIEAGCAVENEGSIRVLEKVGMVREGRKRQTLPLVSGWSDNYEYGILKSDWNQ
jgi:RimJ/RimL family protein N-acetyltransferase